MTEDRLGTGQYRLTDKLMDNLHDRSLSGLPDLLWYDLRASLHNKMFDDMYWPLHRHLRNTIFVG